MQSTSARAHSSEVSTGHAGVTSPTMTPQSSADSSEPDRMAGKRHSGSHIVDDAGQVQDESNDTGGGTGTERDGVQQGFLRRDTSRRGSKPRRRLRINCAKNSRLKRRRSKGSTQSGSKPKSKRSRVFKSCLFCALLCMVLALPFLATGSNLHRWNRTPTSSDRNLSSSISRQ